MTMYRGGFSNSLAPGFRKYTFESYKEKPLEGNKLVHMETSKRAWEEDFNMAGFGTLVEKPEGAKTTLQDILQLNIKRYVWTTYALGFRITQELYEDDLYGIFGSKLSKSLGRSARNNFEVLTHSPYNSAFDTNFNGFVAGEALVSASHALGRGGTASNTPGAVDFSLVALQAAIAHFHGLVEENGLPAMMVPNMLIHTMGDYWTVNQVLKSQFLPGGSQNDINQVANEGIAPHLSHYLLDPDSWFVSAPEHDVNYFERVGPTFSNTDDWSTGDALYKLRRRAGAGYGGWRGIYGSQGA